MMYGANVNSQYKNTPATNERMRISTRVRLPDSDVDFETSMPIRYTAGQKRNPRVNRNQRQQQVQHRQPVKAAQLAQPTKGTVSAKTFAMVLAVVTLFFSLTLLFRVSDMMEKSKQVQALQKTIEQTKTLNEDLESILAEATRDTAVRYSASQKLGLIAGEGANSISIEVPQSLIDISARQMPDTIPTQNSGHTALLGFAD